MSYREFDVVGPAEPSRARVAALIDFGAGVIAAVIAFPFPFARATLPLLVFVASILLSIVVVHVAYVALTLRIFGRTPGMFLLDLGPQSGPDQSRPSLARSLAWALGASIAFWPTVFMVASAYDPRGGTAARMSGIEIRSTKP